MHRADLLYEQFASWKLVLSFIELFVVLRLWRLKLCTVLYQCLCFWLHLTNVQSRHREVLLNLLRSDLDAARRLHLRYIQLQHKQINQWVITYSQHVQCTNALWCPVSRYQYVFKSYLTQKVTFPRAVYMFGVCVGYIVLVCRLQFSANQWDNTV